MTNLTINMLNLGHGRESEESFDLLSELRESREADHGSLTVSRVVEVLRARKVQHVVDRSWVVVHRHVIEREVPELFIITK